ncbi:MAG: TIM barrel protein [Nanoarchaeota archaeon]
MDRLRFGTAGIPHSTKKSNTINGILRVRELELDAFELEFVHSVNIKKDMAPEVKKIAKENDVRLSSHSPYYLNLNAKEKRKMDMSVHLLANSAIITALCGGENTAFHPAFYMKDPKEKAYKTVKENLKRVVDKVKDAGLKIWVRPELTGKRTQFGDLKELIKLSQELDLVLPCIDYAHYHAREGGGNNDYEAFRKLLEELEKGLGREILNNMHIQIAGVNYTEKGERNHMNLKDSDLNWKDILRTWKEFKIKGVVIAETPNIEGDALLLKREFSRI